MTKYRLGDFVVNNWNDWDRVPRDPVTLGLTLFGGGVLTATQLAIATVLFYVGATAVASWVISALTPEIDTSSMRGLLTNTREAAGAQEIVYGKVRKGGVITYMESNGGGNLYLHQIICLAGHEVNAIGDIYINDKVVTLDSDDFVTDSEWRGENNSRNILIKKFTGADDQDVYSTLSTDLALGQVAYPPPDWKVDGAAPQNNEDVNFKGEGIACLYVRLKYDQNVFAEGIPLITAVVEGKKVYDPRTGTTAWSDNPALCIRDYLVSSYGLSDTGDINETSFSAAANTCDESVNMVSGTQTRYQMNGTFQLTRTPQDVLQDMMTSCAGTLFWGQGEWQLKVGEYTTPVKSFTLDDFRSGINLTTKHSRRDNFNIVRGTFIDANQDWTQADYPEIKSSSFISDDNNIESALNLPLPFTTNYAMAQRLAKMTLFRSREQMTLSADFSMKAFPVEVGDVVQITNANYGWSNKDFEVVGWRFSNSEDTGEMLINMTLRETSSAAFSWNAEESEITGNDSTLTDAVGGLSISNLVASGGGATQGDGTFINSVILTWDAPDNNFVSHYEIDWKPTADSNYASTVSSTNSIEISPLVDGTQYIFRVRAVSTSGRRGAYSTVNFTGGGDTTAPALPTSISATGGFKYIAIQWTNPADSDLNYVEVYENTTNTSVGATKVGVSGSNSFVRTNLGLNQTRYYFLKSVDYSGNASAFTSGVSATTTYLDDPDFENGVRQLFIDQGLDIIEPVSSLPLAGDFVGQQVFLTTEGKIYDWNGSSWDLLVTEFSDLQGSIAAGQIPSGIISTTKIADDAITTSKVSANAIGANEIAANAISADKIQSSTITGDKIAANTITSGLLASAGLITSSAQIGSAVISTAQMQDAAITTLKVGGNMITFPQAVVGSGYTDLTVSSSFTTLQTLTATRSGAKSLINATTFFAVVGGGTNGYGLCDYYLYRGSSLVKGFSNAKCQGQNSFSATIQYSDQVSSTSTYYLKVKVTTLNNCTALRFLIPSISFVELKR